MFIQRFNFISETLNYQFYGFAEQIFYIRNRIDPFAVSCKMVSIACFCSAFSRGIGLCFLVSEFTLGFMDFDSFVLLELFCNSLNALTKSLSSIWLLWSVRLESSLSSLWLGSVQVETRSSSAGSGLGSAFYRPQKTRSGSSTNQNQVICPLTNKNHVSLLRNSALPP